MAGIAVIQTTLKLHFEFLTRLMIVRLKDATWPVWEGEQERLLPVCDANFVNDSVRNMTCDELSRR